MKDDDVGCRDGIDGRIKRFFCGVAVLASESPLFGTMKSSKVFRLAEDCRGF